jgi:hypothetical protein
MIRWTRIGTSLRMNTQTTKAIDQHGRVLGWLSREYGAVNAEWRLHRREDVPTKPFGISLGTRDLATAREKAAKLIHDCGDKLCAGEAQPKFRDYRPMMRDRAIELKFTGTTSNYLCYVVADINHDHVVSSHLSMRAAKEQADALNTERMTV